MKQLIRSFACMLMLFLLVACGGSTEEAAPEPAAPAEATAETDAPPEATGSEADAETAGTPEPIEFDGSITLDKSDYTPEEAIVVSLTVNTPVDETAWVGIIPSETPHGLEVESDAVDISYEYLTNMTDGQITLVAPAAPGQYDVRLFNSDNERIGVELAFVSITVSEAEEAAAEEEVLETDEMATDSNEAATSDLAETPTETPEEEDTTTESAEGEETAADSGDACLIGTWRVTNFDEYFLSIIEEAMAGSGQSLEISAESTGDLLLTFDETTMMMSENDFQVIATVAGQTVPVDIEASGTAQYEAADGTITPFVDTLDVDDTVSGLTFDIRSLAGDTITYSCDGDTLSWNPTMGTTVVLSRMN